MSLSLDELKNKQLVWHANRASEQARLHHGLSPEQVLSSGYHNFDQKLGGWPRSGFIELQSEAFGIGELRLLLPVLAHFSEQSSEKNKLQAWLPGGMRLMPQGLGQALTESTVVLNTQDVKESLWALDTLLQSGVCSVVVCWLEQLSPAQAKRLQVAAKESSTLVFCIRTEQAQAESLPISLRIRLNATDKGVLVDVFKRQNAYAVQPFHVDLSAAMPELYARQKVSEAHAYQHNILRFSKAQRSVSN